MAQGDLRTRSILSRQPDHKAALGAIRSRRQRRLAERSDSFVRQGWCRTAQGDLTGALKSYHDSLTIRQRLAQSDPGNADWQRAVAVSYSMLAIAYLRSNDVGNALTALREGQVIMEHLAHLSPDNAVWKNDLDWFNGQIGVDKAGPVCGRRRSQLTS